MFADQHKIKRRGNIMKNTYSFAAAALVLFGSAATADELTMMVEQDLERLGYETGPVDGEETLETVIAISKFQAENNLEVTGEVTSGLARQLMAATPGSGGQTMPATAAAAPAAAQPATDPAALQAAQNACLQEKVATAQASQKKKRGLGRLVSGVARAATRFGGGDLAGDMARTAGDVYAANATADDFAAAAKDLGLTEDDIAACQNP
jgi:peptidoglycan hydrolase-like protein with peptidoglycan-binding domain